MDIRKLRSVCQEILKKTRPQKDEEGQRPFSEKEARIIQAHSNLWWEMLCDAFGVEE